MSHTTHVFILPTAAIAALVPALASAKDVRYYLRGMLLDVTPKGVVLVATDGSRMHALRLPAVTAHPAGTAPIGYRAIIPSSLVAKIKATKRGAQTIVLATNQAYQTASITMDNTTSSGGLVDGTYPDYMRAMPRQRDLHLYTPGTTGIVNPDFLADAVNAIATLSGKKYPAFRFVHRADSDSEQAAVVLSPNAPDFVALVMPITDKQGPIVFPDWLAE